MDTVDLVTDVSRWLDQLEGDLAVKELGFIEGICARAIAAGRGADRADWKIQGRTARVLWAAGRYKRAIKRFDRARELIELIPRGINGLSNDERQLSYDVLAARAECWAYLGYPAAAVSEIERIPLSDRRPWYDWTRAFALHQLAFAENVSFGASVGENVSLAAGSEARYHESNALIASVKRRLSPGEQFDVELLRAANWGGICRRRQLGGGDITESAMQAAAALNTFMSAPTPSSNRAWSWHKEKRGRFPLFKLPIDPAVSNTAIREWRTAYREHYHMNLRSAGLPDRWIDDFVDGDVDPRERHKDDHYV